MLSIKGIIKEYFFPRIATVQNLQDVAGVTVEILPKLQGIAFTVDDLVPVQNFDNDLIDNICTVLDRKIRLEIKSRNYLGETDPNGQVVKRSRNKNEIIVMPYGMLNKSSKILSLVVMGFLKRDVSVAVDFGPKANVYKSFNMPDYTNDPVLNEHFEVYPEDKPAVNSTARVHWEGPELVEDELFVHDFIDNEIVNEIEFYAQCDEPQIEMRERLHGLRTFQHVYVVFKP